MQVEMEYKSMDRSKDMIGWTGNYQLMERRWAEENSERTDKDRQWWAKHDTWGCNLENKNVK